jgi:predicted component of type VI protein secretion system
MPARLVALNGTADIVLAGLLTVVGRHQDCDVRVDSSRVSRRHCCLAICGDGVLVRDLGSTNGTRINGRRVPEGLLRAGDELAIAHLRFRLAWPGPGRPADAAREPGSVSPPPEPGPGHGTTLWDEDALPAPARAGTG